MQSYFKEPAAYTVSVRERKIRLFLPRRKNLFNPYPSQCALTLSYLCFHIHFFTSKFNNVCQYSYSIGEKYFHSFMSKIYIHSADCLPLLLLLLFCWSDSAEVGNFEETSAQRLDSAQTLAAKSTKLFKMYINWAATRAKGLWEVF